MRRRALVKAAVALAALTASALAGWSARKRPAAGEPVEQAPVPVVAADTRLFMDKLRERVPSLVLADELLLRFIHDHAEASGSFELDPQERAPADVARRLLLSTDFFQNGAQEDRALHYVRYYDPYRSSCYDPMAG